MYYLRSAAPNKLVAVARVGCAPTHYKNFLSPRIGRVTARGLLYIALYVHQGNVKVLKGEIAGPMPQTNCCVMERVDAVHTLHHTTILRPLRGRETANFLADRLSEARRGSVVGGLNEKLRLSKSPKCTTQMLDF